MADPTAVRRLHDATVHGGGVEVDRSGLVEFTPLDPRNRPTPFTRWPGHAATPLPRDLAAGRTAGPLDAAALARLLYLTAGVTRRTELGGEPRWFRAAMSAGNLHPIEVYVGTGNLDGVDPGLHHLDPLELALTPLRGDDPRPLLAHAAAEPSIAEAEAVLLLTGVVWRTAWKYRERGWRHLFWDAGTMLANLLAVAEFDGREVRVLLGFDDEVLSRAVGADSEQELPLALAVIGPPALGAGPGEATTGGSAAPPARSIQPPEAARAPLAAYPIPLPMVLEAQAAGDLAAPGVTAWREQLAAQLRPVPEGESVTALLEGGSIDEAILQRGSTRMMERAPAARRLLDSAMRFAARPVPGDLGGGTLLEHHLSVHAVEGREPGHWRWAGEEGELVQPATEEEAREAATHLCLDQPLGGDSAYTAFHSADLDPLLDGAGARAYRAAQLEAGVASGRLALAAFALGGGATGLTFYDEEVRRHFGTQASPLLVTSVGVPAYRNRAGGEPGAAAELTGFGPLMERLQLDLRRRR